MERTLIGPSSYHNINNNMHITSSAKEPEPSDPSEPSEPTDRVRAGLDEPEAKDLAGQTSPGGPLSSGPPAAARQRTAGRKLPLPPVDDSGGASGDDTEGDVNGGELDQFQPDDGWIRGTVPSRMYRLVVLSFVYVSVVVVLTQTNIAGVMKTTCALVDQNDDGVCDGREIFAAVPQLAIYLVPFVLCAVIFVR